MGALPEISELYELHRRRALAIARRIVKDADDAEDVVQDVFVRLFSRDVNFDGNAAPSTWLHRVMVNSSINSLRARKRRSTLECPLMGEADPLDRTIEQEQHQRLLQAIETLSEQHRMVVTLRDVRGYSYPEIARMLGLPEGTVKSALNRARARLAKALNRMGEKTDGEMALVG